MHKHRLWSAMHVGSSHSDRIRKMDDSALFAPLAVTRPDANKSVRRLRSNNETSTVVSERVYMALQRGVVRSTLEIDDLMLFVSQVRRR